MMLRIAEFEPLANASGALYRPRVYGDAREMSWDGYIVFFPIGTSAVVSTPRETTQPTLGALQSWSRSLDTVYLEGALIRALGATTGVTMPTTARELDLVAAETLAAGDAIALHNVAERAAVEAASTLATAEMHEQAAEAARESAERLSRKGVELEDLAQKTARAAAEVEAEMHKAVARGARAVAADVDKRAGAAARGKKRRRSTARSDRRKHR